LETCNSRFEPRYVMLESAHLLQLSQAGMDACAQHLATVDYAAQVKDIDGTCGAMWTGLQTVGGACGFDVESLVCAPGTACVLGLDLCGTCKTQSAAGDACGGDLTCGAEASCSGGHCVARIPAGQACAPTDNCVLGASCVGGTCSGPSYSTVGQPCDQTHRCPYKSVCAGGSCVEAALQGEACGGNVTCASGYCAGGVCQAPLSVGAACSLADQCESAQCVQGHCAPLPSPCFTRDAGN